jgi:hypothetical protein
MQQVTENNEFPEAALKAIISNINLELVYDLLRRHMSR